MAASPSSRQHRSPPEEVSRGADAMDSRRGPARRGGAPGRRRADAAAGPGSRGSAVGATAVHGLGAAGARAASGRRGVVSARRGAGRRRGRCPGMRLSTGIAGGATHRLELPPESFATGPVRRHRAGRRGRRFALAAVAGGRRRLAARRRCPMRRRWSGLRSSRPDGSARRRAPGGPRDARGPRRLAGAAARRPAARIVGRARGRRALWADVHDGAPLGARRADRRDLVRRAGVPDTPRRAAHRADGRGRDRRGRWSGSTGTGA